MGFQNVARNELTKLILRGNDALKLQEEATTWVDLRFPFNRDRQGVADKPDFDFTNHGLLFPQNNPAEEIYITDQMPHEWKLGSNIYPHIHFIQTTADAVVWKMDYRFYKNGDTPPAFTSGVAHTGLVFTYSTGSILQIATWPVIDLSAIDTVSAWMDIRVYRDDNVVTGDVLGKGFDIHIEIDDLGSRTEYAK